MSLLEDFLDHWTVTVSKKPAGALAYLGRDDTDEVSVAVRSAWDRYNTSKAVDGSAARERDEVLSRIAYYVEIEGHVALAFDLDSALLAAVATMAVQQSNVVKSGNEKMEKIRSALTSIREKMKKAIEDAG